MSIVNQGDFVIVKKRRTQDYNIVEVADIARTTFMDTDGHVHFKSNIEKISPIKVGEIIITKTYHEKLVVNIEFIIAEESEEEHLTFWYETEYGDFYSLNDIIAYKIISKKGPFTKTKTVMLNK